jgi:hypothetical protein
MFFIAGSWRRKHFTPEEIRAWRQREIDSAFDALEVLVILSVVGTIAGTMIFGA